MAGRNIGWVQGGCAVSICLCMVVPVGGCKVDTQSIYDSILYGVTMGGC